MNDSKRRATKSVLFWDEKADPMKLSERLEIKSYINGFDSKKKTTGGPQVLGSSFFLLPLGFFGYAGILSHGHLWVSCFKREDHLSRSF